MSLINGLYVCLFSQGTIKVGHGRNVSLRITAHRHAAAAFGISMDRHYSVASKNPKKAEQELIAWCAERCTSRNGFEWFNGIDFDECISAAKDIAESVIYQPSEHSVSKQFACILEHFKPQSTKESDLYVQVRRMMQANSVDAKLISMLDFLHLESEKARAAMRNGALMPEWFDTLNCFEFWEIELWFDKGIPSPELIEAAVDAIRSIAGEIQ